MSNSSLIMGSASAPGGGGGGLTIVGVDTKFGNAASVHTLTGVAANTLLVVTTGDQNGGYDCTVSSSPALTWTKRVDAQTPVSPNAEIWTATFVAGGSITVTSNWGASVQTSVCYQMTGSDTIIGNGTVGISQSVGDISVTSTRTNSIIIAMSNNWNVADGGIGGSLTQYRNADATPVQTYYYTQAPAATFWHYYYPAQNIKPYNVGYISPADIDNGTSTVALEIRSLNGTGPTPDTTNPVMGVLSSTSNTFNTISLSWTSATDNVGVTGYEVRVGGALVTTVTGNTYQLTGLTPSTTYSIVVRAKDAAGNFNDSNTLSVTTSAQPVDTTPPSAPTLTQVSKTAVTINVSWTAATDNVAMANYGVYLNGSLVNTVSTATLSYQYTGLTASTTYSLVVRAIDTSGNFTNSNTLSVTTNPTTDTTPPSAPVLSAPSPTDIDVNTVVLNWTASTDNVSVTGYDVYISPSTLFTTTTSLTTTVTGLAQNTSYTFFVRAKDAAGNTAQSNSVTVTTDTAVIGGQPLTFTALTNDYRRYWGGPEEWGGRDLEQNVGYTHAHRYRRFVWNDWEGSPAGSYRFAENFGNSLKNFLDAGIANKQLVSFGIMTCYPGFDSNNSFHTRTSFGGIGAAYPTYLHNLMQAESQPDWENGDCWTPNWNSPNYISRFTALMVALNSFLNTTHSSGIKYGDAVGYIDLRGMGAYGEWHSYGIVTDSPIADIFQYPGFAWNTSGGQKNITSYGAFATPASLIQIIDAQRNNLPDWPLTTILNSLDGNFPNGGTGTYSGYFGTGFINTGIPVSVGQYLINNGNAWGPIGRRRDQWGDSNNYYSTVAEQTNAITGIPARWQTSPVNGEPPGYAVPDPCNNGTMMQAFPAQAVTQHASIVGNSNYGGCNPTSGAMQTAFKSMGCILRLTGGTVNLTSTQLIITLNWRNFGVAPQYKKDWVVTFELRSTGGTLAWTSTSSFNPFLFLPSGTSNNIVDTKTRPVVAAGAYTLSLVIKDAKGYLEPLQLGINGRQEPSGSYILTTLNF